MSARISILNAADLTVLAHAQARRRRRRRAISRGSRGARTHSPWSPPASPSRRRTPACSAGCVTEAGPPRQLPLTRARIGDLAVLADDSVLFAAEDPALGPRRRRRPPPLSTALGRTGLPRGAALAARLARRRDPRNRARQPTRRAAPLLAAAWTARSSRGARSCTQRSCRDGVGMEDQTGRQQLAAHHQRTRSGARTLRNAARLCAGAALGRDGARHRVGAARARSQCRATLVGAHADRRARRERERRRACRGRGAGRRHDPLVRAEGRRAARVRVPACQRRRLGCRGRRRATTPPRPTATASSAGRSIAGPTPRRISFAPCSSNAPCTGRICSMARSAARRRQPRTPLLADAPPRVSVEVVPAASSTRTRRIRVRAESLGLPMSDVAAYVNDIPVTPSASARSKRRREPAIHARVRRADQRERQHAAHRGLQRSLARRSGEVRRRAWPRRRRPATCTCWRSAPTNSPRSTRHVALLQRARCRGVRRASSRRAPASSGRSR